LIATAFVATAGGGAKAQEQQSAPERLRQQLEQRFDILTVQDGLVLRPKAPTRDVRWIEVSGGTVSLNGALASGAELRERLGDDAAAVVQLSYLEPAARAALFRDATGAPLADQTDPDSGSRRSDRRSEGGRFRIGGDITVQPEDIVSGDVVTVGGSAYVFGEVRGDVVAIGGAVELGPTSRVSGDVTVIGGSLQRASTARVGGEVVDLGDVSIGEWRERLLGSRWRRGPGTFGSALALFSTLMRVAILCLFAALVVLLGRDHLPRISARAVAEPLKAGAIGLLTQLLLLPLLIVTTVLLIVTIVGIPLLTLIPLALLALAAVALVGFTAVAHRVGDRLRLRFGWTPGGPYATTLVGILILVSPLLLARLLGLAGGLAAPAAFSLVIIGTVLEYAAWTIGFGAVALARFGASDGAVPVSSGSPGPGSTSGNG
jgi:hypothetical protein